MLGVDLANNMTVDEPAPDEPPSVEYSSMLANPFEKKRILKSLGYLSGVDGFSSSENNLKVEDSDLMKGIGSVLRVLEDNITCSECNRSFFDEDTLERHKNAMHSTYTIDELVRHQDKYSCPACARTFGLAVSLYKHYWLNHSSTGGDIQMKSAQGVLHAIPLPTKQDKLEPLPKIPDTKPIK